ncbi:MAG: tetratricopeptide repeat protein [Bacteroidales bacterium]|nr:tetratricopeptide repeat protein [Bacteroidales bacterium]MBR6227372.1 tetratricopeptide repeat protein [Bacteroidales bacterium]
MKRLSLLLLILLSLGVIAQNESPFPLPDSLAGRLKEHRKTDFARAEALDAAIRHYADNKKILEAQGFIYELADLSADLHDNYWKAVSLYYKSLCAYDDFDFEVFLSMINESMGMVELLRDTKRTQLLAARIYLAKSGYFYYIKQFPECQKYIERGLQLCEKNGFEALKSDFISNYGALLIGMEKYEAAILKFKSLSKFQKTPSSSLLNIAICYGEMKQFDSVLFYADSVIRFEQIGGDSVLEKDRLLTAYSIKTSCHLDLEQWDEALQCLNQSVDVFLESNDKNRLSLYYLDLARVYNGKGDYNEALKHIDRAISMSQNIRNIEAEWVAVKVKSEILDNMKDYVREVENMWSFIGLTDTLFSRESRDKVIEQQYQQQALTKEMELRMQQMAARQKLFVTILVAILLVIAIVFVSGIIIRKRKRKTEQLSAELDLRNREITSKSIGRMQSNEILNDVIEKLNEMERHPENNVLPGVIRDLKSLVSTETKKDFDVHFVQMNPDFYQKLLADYPKLTQNELRLCAFIKSNLSIKEIAALNGISADSVKTARKRLRKSLNLTGEDMSLLEFLSKY